MGEENKITQNSTGRGRSRGASCKRFGKLFVKE